MAFANAGIPVLLKEADQAALDRGMATIRKNYATSVKRGRFTQTQMDERMELIKPTVSYDEFGEADIVIEAVFEGMDLKKQVFGELDKVCSQMRFWRRTLRRSVLMRLRRRRRGRRRSLGSTSFQSGERDAAAGNRAWQGVERRGDCDVHGVVEDAGQSRRVGGQLSWICRQSHVWTLPARGAVLGGRRRESSRWIAR